jgi:hypothetical protein
MSVDESQFEDRVRDREPDDSDLTESQRARLGAHRLLRTRLQSAFAAVAPPEGFAQRLADRLEQAPETQEEDQEAQTRSKTLRFPGRLAASAAIAAGLVLAVGILWRLGTPAVANAQPELFRIHQANLAAGPSFIPISDVQDARTQLGRMTGMEDIRLPVGDTDANVDGCADGKVFEEKIASYRLALPEGHVSVIVLQREVPDLGFGHQFRQAGHQFASCRHRDCRMVAVRLGQWTYVAVSDKVDQSRLTQVLTRLAAQD